MVEGVLDQRVVQRLEQQWPLPVHPAFRVAGENMAQHDTVTAVVELPAMLADEPRRSGEAEARELAGLVLEDSVADRPVTALVAHLHASLEAHRRPAVVGPESIVIPSQALDQRSRRAAWWQDALVDVVDSHRSVSRSYRA